MRISQDVVIREYRDGDSEPMADMYNAIFPDTLQTAEEMRNEVTRLALVEQRVGKVDHWTTSDQKQRWLAATLLEIEPRLRRLRGYRALPQLRIALKTAVTQGKEVMVA